MLLFSLCFGLLIVNNVFVEPTRIHKRQPNSNTKSSAEDKLSKTIHQLLNTLEDNDSATFQFNHKLITISSDSKDKFIKELKKHKDGSVKNNDDMKQVNSENINEDQFLDFLSKYEDKTENKQTKAAPNNEQDATISAHTAVHYNQVLSKKNLRSSPDVYEYQKTSDLHSKRNYPNNILESSKTSHSKKQDHEKLTKKKLKRKRLHLSQGIDNSNDLTVSTTQNSYPINPEYQNMLQKKGPYGEYGQYYQLKSHDKREKDLVGTNSGMEYNQKIIQRNLQLSGLNDDDRINAIEANKNVYSDLIDASTDVTTRKYNLEKTFHSKLSPSDVIEYNALNANTNYHNKIEATTTIPIYTEQILQNNPKSAQMGALISPNPINSNTNNYDPMYYYNAVNSYRGFPRHKRQSNITQDSTEVSKYLESIEELEEDTEVVISNKPSLPFDYDGDLEENYNNDNITDCPKLKVGEKEIVINDAPYHVAYGRACGGAIVHRKWVLTAAHCKKEFYILYGTNDIKFGKVMKVANHHPHPGWKRDHKHHAYDYNYQLLELKEPLPESFGGQVINIGDVRNLSLGTNVSVIGWAVTEEGEKYPYVLRDFQAPLVDKMLCNNKDDLEFRGNLTDRMFCAGYPDGNNCGCQVCASIRSRVVNDMLCFLQDDAGSPVVANKQLVGLVSFGRRCSSGNSYGVYSDVFSIKSWIQNTIGEQPE